MVDRAGHHDVHKNGYALGFTLGAVLLVAAVGVALVMLPRTRVDALASR